MQCPQCNAQNHSSRDRCIECGADLFAVPEPTPTILVAVGGVGFAVMGVIDLLIMDSMKNRHSMPVRGSLGIAWLLYQFIGKWPVPIVMWAISAQLLLRARRETIAKRVANTGPQAANPGPRVTGTVAPAAAAGAPRLHRTLLVSLLVTTALVLTVRYRGIDPGLSPAATATVGFVCAALAPRSSRSRSSSPGREFRASMPDCRSTRMSQVACRWPGCSRKAAVRSPPLAISSRAASCPRSC